MRHTTIDGVLVVCPTREDVANLRVGDLAPDCFGKWARVTEIFAKRDDITGRLFACYYTEWKKGVSALSGSIKESEVVCTLPLTKKWHTTHNFLAENPDLWVDATATDD